MVIDFKQPITLAHIEADRYYINLIQERWNKSDAIFKTVKSNLWDQYFAQDWRRLGKQIRESPDPDKLYEEGDDMDNRCELQAYAICRKNNLLGPQYEFSLWNMPTPNEKYGIHIIPSKK